MTATAERLGAPPAPHPARPRAFRHRPGLEGLRGVAVAGVLAYHLDPELVPGGYLGVSAFFTLSGFLITTLLLREHDHEGRISFAAFWARRARRLLPVALLGIGGGVLLVVLTGDLVAVEQVRLDALSALAYVANWRFVFRELSYAELFTAESPLQHLWSLAIEEQFYLALPLGVAALGRRGRLAVRIGVTSVALIALSLVASGLAGDLDRQYYGTDTRAVELLVGVGLACAFHLNLTARLSRRVVDAAGGLALVAVLAIWLSIGTLDTSTQPWILFGHALLTGAIVLAALGGPMAGLLGRGPLTALGRVSYGVYVYHWPIYLWLDHERTGLDGIALDGLRVGVTLGAAALSAKLIEHPIRSTRSRRPRRDLLVSGVAIAIVAGGVALATTSFAPEPLIDFDEAIAITEELDGADLSPTETTVPPPPSATRVAIFGDSTALMLVPGMKTWSRLHPERMALVRGFAELGCPLGRGGARVDGDVEVPIPDGCDFTTRWREALVVGQPDVAVVQIGVWDIVDRIIPGSDETVRFGDPIYDAFLEAEANAATDHLLKVADRVVWVLQPAPIASTRLAEDPAPVAIPVLNDRLLEWLGGRPDVAFVDLAGWLQATGQATSTDLRPDGTHYSSRTSVTAAGWLAPAVLRAAAEGGIVRAGDVEVVPAS